MAGYGIKVQTNTGRWVWVTATGTHVQKNARGVLKFESEAGAMMDRNMLAYANPTAILIVKKF